MDDSNIQNPVAALRERLGLTYEQLGEKLGCSKGHAADLCVGRRMVGQGYAFKLEELSGRPWHEWMPSKSSEAEADAPAVEGTEEGRDVDTILGLVRDARHAHLDEGPKNPPEPPTPALTPQLRRDLRRRERLGRSVFGSSK